jgi:hypothetical protein
VPGLASQVPGGQEAAAAAEFRELANGRADLLAGVCGIMAGVSEGELNEPIARQAAELCRKAGADPEAIPAWGRAADAPRSTVDGARDPRAQTALSN